MLTELHNVADVNSTWSQYKYSVVSCFRIRSKKTKSPIDIGYKFIPYYLVGCQIDVNLKVFGIVNDTLEGKSY